MINKTFNSFEEGKEYVKNLLEKTDYVCLVDVKEQLLNYQDFFNYRFMLRNYIIKPSFSIILPEEPKPIWK